MLISPRRNLLTLKAVESLQDHLYISWKYVYTLGLLLGLRTPARTFQHAMNVIFEVVNEIINIATMME